jgi:hypothetical protein
MTNTEATDKTEPPVTRNVCMSNSVMPGDLAGAISVYIEARRRLAEAWGDQRAADTRIAAAVREDYAAGAAVLEIVWQHWGAER